jgi:hypothetical protein
MKIAFCIRGHLRDGLSDNRLLNYIRLLRKKHEVDLFLHTWSESEAKSSYRPLDYSKVFVVKESHLTDYFAECNIKKIIISNDSQVKLYGNTLGKLPGDLCPVLAWKRMWAGKFELMSSVLTHSGEYDRAITTRYDMFTNTVCYTPVKNLLALSDDVSKLSLKYPKYYRLLKGVDNYYAGTVETLHSISYDFHYGLDSILQGKSVKAFHEEIFYKYAVDSNYV